MEDDEKAKDADADRNAAELLVAVYSSWFVLQASAALCSRSLACLAVLEALVSAVGGREPHAQGRAVPIRCTGRP